MIEQLSTVPPKTYESAMRWLSTEPDDTPRKNLNGQAMAVYGLLPPEGKERINALAHDLAPGRLSGWSLRREARIGMTAGILLGVVAHAPEEIQSKEIALEALPEDWLDRIADQAADLTGVAVIDWLRDNFNHVSAHEKADDVRTVGFGVMLACAQSVYSRHLQDRINSGVEEIERYVREQGSQADQT